MTNINPFDVLLEIEKSCKESAVSLPRQKDPGETWTGIGFITGNLHLVAPISEVNEVLPCPSLSLIPSSASWFKGVANHRGHLLPITDLQNFISGTPLLLSPFCRVLVIDFEKTSVGFMVHQVLGIQHFLEKNLLPLNPEENDPKFLPFLQGEFVEDNIKWKILSLQSLTKTAQFYHVIKEASK